MANNFTYADANIVGTSYVLVYTCPVNQQALIIDASVANTEADARLVNARLARASDTPGALDDVQLNLAVNPSADTFVDKLINKVLNAGDQILMNMDDTGSVNVFLSIREISL